MRNYKLLTVWLILGASILNCGLPSKPDFTTSQKVESPFLLNKTFQFLGGGDGSVEALIDTTKGDMDSLFTVTNNGDDAGLVYISREEEFDFGDLNDAIPSISADPTDFSTQVGEIEMGSFSSGSDNLGTASFQALTGLDPGFVPAGTPIAGGTTPAPVNIAVGNKTDFFVSATIKRGALEIGVTNNLGFDISAIDITLNSGNTPVGNTTLNNVNHGATTSSQIVFSEGDVLQSINVDITVSWLAQTTTAEPGELVVENLNGVGLVASAVEAAVPQQNFSSTNTSSIDATEFQFTSPLHYVQLESGSIEIDPIINDLDLTIDSLIISFPGILRPPYRPQDSLRIRYLFENGVDGRILRSSTSEAKLRDLSGFRVYATNNEIDYTIYAVTENTQQAAAGDQTRVITETDGISSSVSITNLVIAEAFGEIQPQVVLLGDDDPTNGVDIIDIYNDSEVSITALDGLEDFSGEIEGIEFSGASLSITYTSNIGVPTTIYAGILGINGEGEEVFLRGLAGTDKEVQASDPVSGILSNNTPLGVTQMIKFTLDPSLDGSTITSSVTFDETNSTVNEFLNNLPSEIRFIGKSVINQEGTEATIATPLEFDPGLMVDLPIYFSADAASYSTSQEVTAFEDFPAEDDNLTLTNGELIIGYNNGFPFGFDIEMNFISSTGDTVTRVPLPSESALELLAGEVDASSRFVNNPTDGNLIISMSPGQLSQLYRADSLAITARLNTFNTEAVKLRDTDSITLSVSGSFTIENKIGN